MLAASRAIVCVGALVERADLRRRQSICGAEWNDAAAAPDNHRWAWFEFHSQHVDFSASWLAGCAALLSDQLLGSAVFQRQFVSCRAAAESREPG